VDIFSIIAEDKIRKAMEDGEFDNLPGKGKPLQLEDLSHIPEELRVAYKVMKNANMVNDIDTLQKELMTIEDLIDSCTSNEDSKRYRKEKRVIQMRLDALLKKRKSLDTKASAYYKERMLERLKKQ
jgi:Domain of unknown function (DUF1992)